MRTVAIVSFRLGLTDGVSVVADSWASALTDLGLRVVTVAGEGPVDRRLPGLAIAAGKPPSPRDLADALAGADLVVVENLCTIPLNLPASRLVAQTLRGRPAILHHHDPAWQRPQFAHVTELPFDDPARRHVAINEMTRRQFTDRGIVATTIYNGFEVDRPRRPDRHRAGLDVADGERLLVHPVRAIARKDVPAAVRLAEALGAVYWLLGPAEDGYDAELARVLRAARCRVVHHRPDEVIDAHAAADAVAFPSTWEGFGNPPIEAALHRRPCAVGRYPVAAELVAMGFRWFPSDDATPLAAFLDHPDRHLLDHNEDLARQNFSQQRVTDDVARLLEEAGWRP